MKLICFDCDSTLSSIEGIDELARLRGPAVFGRIQAMTEDAMNGKIPIESVFGLRLAAISPTLADARAIGESYIRHVEPSARDAVLRARAQGWTPVIVSGGFRQAIRPLADFLGIQRIEAVDLRFAPDGTYAGYDAAYPSTRSGGKIEIIEGLRRELGARKIVMVGDGASDLETRPVVDLFVGYGGFTARPKVKAGSAAFVTALSEIPALLAPLGE